MSVPRPVVLVCAAVVAAGTGGASASASAADGTTPAPTAGPVQASVGAPRSATSGTLRPTGTRRPLSVVNDGVHALTKTTDGIRWSLRGARLSITVTDDAPHRVRRRVLGKRVTAACGTEARTTAGLATTHVDAAFPRATGVTVRVRFPKHLRRVTSCVLEAEGQAEDLAVVVFVPGSSSQVAP